MYLIKLRKIPFKIIKISIEIEGSKYPDYIKKDTDFKKGEKITVEYDWAEKEHCMNGYKSIWHKNIGIFVVKDIYCNMLINPSETMITLYSEDEIFIKRCNCQEFDVFENLLIGRLRN